MKRSATRRPENESSHEARFFPVLDSRKRKVRGLWMRNSRYYGQLRVDSGNGKTRPVRLPLKASTLDAAKAELAERQTERRGGTIHLPGFRPKFEALAKEYQLSAEFLAKKEGARQNETQALNRRNNHLGGVRADWIKSSHLTSYRNERAKTVTARTVNLDMVAFNNAMTYAISAGYITTPPRVKKLEEVKAPKWPSLQPDDVVKLLEVCKSGRWVSSVFNFQFNSAGSPLRDEGAPG